MRPLSNNELAIALWICTYTTVLDHRTKTTIKRNRKALRTLRGACICVTIRLLMLPADVVGLEGMSFKLQKAMRA